MWIYHFDLDFSSNGTYRTFNPIFVAKLLAKLISVISQDLAINFCSTEGLSLIFSQY